MTLWPEDTERVILDEVDSTNDEAARRAPPARPVWIMARRQTASRGRRGRGWCEPAGNLAATYLFRPDCSPGTGALYSFVACLALGDLFAALAPGARITFKWPNDALVDGGKAAGILLESRGGRERLDWLAIGVGVNLVGAPTGVDIRPGGMAPIALTDVGADPTDPETALDILAPAFARWQRRFQGEGFGPIRAAWLARAARLGQTIGAGLAQEHLTGTFEDVDTAGRLVLRTADGLRLIPAADIFFPE